MVIQFNQKNNQQKHYSFTTGQGYYKHHPVFSFRYYKQLDKYYSIEHSNKHKNGFYKFLNSSKDFSNMTWRDISKDSKQFHFHDIDKDIPELQDFEIKDVVFVQFKLPNHKQSRFVGFFDERSIFNIVIFDYDHNICKRK